MRVKLIDVANKAGVSKSTVSQYINGRYEYMSPTTKERIRLAIEEIGFVPNQIARSLKTRKTSTIGVIVNSISGATTSQVIRGIDDYCKKHDYNLLIYNTDYIPAIEKQSIATLKALGADGLIITSSGEINELLNDVDDATFPVVHIHRTFDGLNVSTVLSEYKQGAYDGTSHLIGLGHERIALITRPYEGIPTRYDRIKGYAEALEAHNLCLDKDLIRISTSTEDIVSVYTSLMALPKPPTAIFSMYSNITIDLLNYFNKSHIILPDTISLMAFDDLPLAELLKTPLTAINQACHTLGERSAELLLTKILHGDSEATHLTLPCNLIERSSCKNLTEIK